MKKIDPLQLLREEVKTFIPYKPSRTIEQISEEIGVPVEKIAKLDTGENPYVDFLQDRAIIDEIQFSGYPDPFSLDLRKKLADYTDFGIDWIMCGNGSDEIIDLVIRVFAGPNEEIIINPPTFPMYAFSAQLSGAKTISVLRKKDFTIDTNAIIEKITPKTKIVFIESPGNPSNVVTPNSEFEKILKKNVIVVADEAYFEYCGKTAASLIKQYPNLIVIRTLSKWAGLAGLRIGYAIADPKITSILLATKQPYNINVVAQKLASRALDNKAAILSELKKIITLRTKLYETLSSFPQLKVYESEGAYIVFTPNVPAETLREFLKKKGVLIKVIHEPLLENSIRVNLRKEREIEMLADGIRRFYETV